MFPDLLVVPSMEGLGVTSLPRYLGFDKLRKLCK